MKLLSLNFIIAPNCSSNLEEDILFKKYFLLLSSLDDKLSLYQVNATWFEEESESDSGRLEGDLSSWRALNLVRSVGVVLGWMLVSLRPTTDLLHKHLKKLVAVAADSNGPKKA